MRFGLMLWLSLLVAAAWGGPVSVPLTVTPPAPQAFTAQISQPVTLNGQAYAVTGTLTFTPATGVAELPPSGPPVWRPMIQQFLENGQPILTAHLGDELTLKGQNFSDDGVLVIGNDVVPTLSWTDDEIHVLLDPAVVTAAPNGSFFTLRRGVDSEHGWCDGPIIKPRPPGT